MQAPLISVLIPSYNAEKTIEKTIISVLNQTYHNFELIIVDDNSKDSTRNIINKFKDPRIKLYINESNLGFEGNWNKTLEKANGEFIKLLPDDDTLEKDALKKQLEILEKYENVILVSSKRNIITSDDTILIQRGTRLGIKNLCKSSDTKKFIYKYGTNPIGEPSAVLFRSTILSYNLKFDASRTHYIDLDFYLKVFQFGDYYFIDETLSNFRVWERSYSVSNRFDNLRESLSFFDEIYKRESTLNSLDFLISRFNIYKNWLLKNLFYLYLQKTNKL